MRESKYLRLALMFGDNNATTFSKNLEKMISLVLHDHFEEPMSVVEIIDELKSSYGLDFSETEVIDAIKSKRQNRIICIGENKDSSQNKYSITPEAKATIDAKVDSSVITDTATLFLQENLDINVDVETFENTLKKYFYSVFNSNATTISELLDKKISADLEGDVSFSDFEKELINSFLEWNNGNKDQCVYQMVSCCFDYCMMTVKRDTRIYQDMFRQKRFYLDTNIIFRMMGLNRENRKKLIDTFIGKCKDAGIDIRYTNHTRKEINETIEHHVRQIKNLLNSKEPISAESLRVLSSKYYNLSFYEAYVSWCAEPSNKAGDYTSFATDLKWQARSIMREFVSNDFDGFDTTKPDEFTRYCEDLKAEKLSRRGYAKDEIVQTDINNFMYVRSLNEREKATDFSNTHHYLISTDHILGDWARKKRPESVPIVVLPSVWYSLILQYTGRTDDDFASFARFLNFSLSSPEDEEDPRKIAILKKVIELDEPKEIKERTIFDIEAKLQTDYKDLDSVDEIVESSHECILDQERARITEEVQRQADLRVENFKADSTAELNRLLREKELEKTEEKARHVQAELELAEKNKELEDKINEARKQGERNRAESLADAALTRTILFYWIIGIILICAFIFVGSVIILKLTNGEFSWLPKVYEKAPFVIDVFVEVIIGITGFAVFSKGLCGLDRDKIRERLIVKYSR